jgi:hypothetical protein
LTEETRQLRMLLDELRDGVVWAARQVLAARYNVTEKLPQANMDPQGPAATRPVKENHAVADVGQIARNAKLRAISERWFNEPLAVQFPSLGVDMNNPSTCAEFAASPRIIGAEEATNLEHFGAGDPKAVLIALSAQFEAAIGGRVDPKILKDAAAVLDVFKADSEKLASHFAPNTAQRDDTLHDSYLADAKAAEQCQTILTELATELGNSLLTEDDHGSCG